MPIFFFTLYIHQHICVSAQQTLGTEVLERVNPSKEGRLIALEPSLDGVPPAMQRRMGKAMRMGLGSGLPILTNTKADGIILGTANGGMEDCIKFLNQVIDYDEGLLTPANFVQSTPNSIAGQLSLITKNRAYNATHVHLGLAFENALLDAQMLLAENIDNQYLVGAVDEISSYNYNIDLLAGWYGTELGNTTLYDGGASATVAGEGAAMFLVNNRQEGALAQMDHLETLHTTCPDAVKKKFDAFLNQARPDTRKTVVFFGENGDNRLQPFYDACAPSVEELPVIRFKHLSGEYPTASSFALWLACHLLETQSLPAHCIKKGSLSFPIEHVLVYNHYQGKQHSFFSLALKK